MKVLMFGWEFPPHISGGLGTACYGLTRGLLHNGVAVSFVVPRAFGDEDTRQIQLISANDIPVPGYTMANEFLTEKFTYYGLNSLLVPYLNTEQFEQYSGEIINNASTTKRESSFYSGVELTGQYGKNLVNEVWPYALVASQIAQNNTFDIIHAHDWLSFPAGLLAKKVSGKPLIVHIHATEFDRSGEHINQQVYDIERRGMELADKVIAVSDFTKQIIINRYGIPAEKIEVVHNAIDEKDTPVVDNRPNAFPEKIITYLGRITFQKGPEYFVEAAAKVLQMDKAFRFVMAGSGDMLNRMIRKAANLRISSNFHFTVFLKSGNVDKMLAMSSVYVMPSVSEPFGISPLEAVKSNVPVIISKQSGVSEVLKHAIKVDFWDTDAMANAMYALAKFNGLKKMFVRESRNEMNNLKWSVQAGKIKEIYRQLLN